MPKITDLSGSLTIFQIFTSKNFGLPTNIEIAFWRENSNIYVEIFKNVTKT